MKVIAYAFFSIAIAVLAGGCNRPASTAQGTTAASNPVTQVSQALVGKHITIRGKLLIGKQGQGIQLDNDQAVYLKQMNPKPVLEDPYPEMYDKLVEATGTLRLYHNPDPIDETRDRAIQRAEDFYYFYYETTQVRLVGR